MFKWLAEHGIEAVGAIMATIGTSILAWDRFVKPFPGEAYIAAHVDRSNPAIIVCNFRMRAGNGRSLSVMKIKADGLDFAPAVQQRGAFNEARWEPGHFRPSPLDMAFAVGPDHRSEPSWQEATFFVRPARSSSRIQERYPARALMVSRSSRIARKWIKLTISPIN